MNVERPEIEAFLYMEARLLDTQRFDEWLALFTEDALYWVPIGHENIDPTRHVSLIHDDKPAMALRVKRLKSGHAYAQEPASRVHRLISNVELLELSADDQRLEVSCMMLLVELARHRQTTHTARCDFTLRRTQSGWSISRKKVNLLKCDEVLENTPFLI